MHPIFNRFYMATGVRRPQNLFSPQLHPLGELPVSSAVHLHSLDGMHDIDTSQLWLARTPLYYVDSIDTLTSMEGTPRRKPVQLKLVTRPWFARHKSFRWSVAPDTTVKDRQVLLIYNYQYLSAIYQYRPHPLAKWQEHLNLTRTMWDRIAAISESSDRHHFVFIDLPAQLPGYQMLKVYANKVSPAMLKIFDTAAKLDILQLWRWIDPSTRSQSSMSKLDASNCNHVNIVFRLPDGRVSVLNLGYLNSWVRGSDNLTEFTSVPQFTTDQVHKLFLKYLITMQSMIVPEGAVAGAASPDDVSVASSDGGTASAIDTDGDLDDVDLTSQLAHIDEDLVSLDVLSKRKIANVGLKVDAATSELVEDETAVIDVESVHASVYQVPDITDALRQQLDTYTDQGGMSASDYKKTLASIEAYPKMRDPYGSKQTIDQAMVIGPEDLIIDAGKSKLVGPDSVLDRTMLQSTLNSLDEDYIQNIMHKDILQMVADVQRAGVVIRSHEIEIDASAMGVYENHTLELKPIDGLPSTIRFRVPKIKPDGTFLSNSNKYSMRKQVVD